VRVEKRMVLDALRLLLVGMSVDGRFSRLCSGMPVPRGWISGVGGVRCRCVGCCFDLRFVFVDDRQRVGLDFVVSGCESSASKRINVRVSANMKRLASESVSRANEACVAKQDATSSEVVKNRRFVAGGETVGVVCW
jgi:hypothetical protein